MVVESKYSLRSLDRVVVLLDCFTSEKPELGVTELAIQVGMGKGTVHRLMSAMEGHHLVEQDKVTRRYRLGLKLLELGGRVAETIGQVSVAQPFLRSLVEEYGETAHMAILDEGMTRYVAKVEGSRALRTPSRIGAHLPAHCTASGKVLMAHLSDAEVDAIVRTRGLPGLTTRTITDPEIFRRELKRIRRRGYAIDNQELEHGLRCIAVPIRDHTNQVVLSISLSGPNTRLTDAVLSGVAERLLAISEKLSETLGGVSLQTR